MLDQLDARNRLVQRSSIRAPPADVRGPRSGHGCPRGASTPMRTRAVVVVVAIAACVAAALVIAALSSSPGGTTRRRCVRRLCLARCAAPRVCGEGLRQQPDVDTVSVITMSTGGVSAPIPVGAIRRAGGHTGRQARLRGQPGRQRRSRTVSVIDTATGAVSEAIAVGTRPGIVGITPDGKHVYVLNSATPRCR